MKRKIIKKIWAGTIALSVLISSIHGNFRTVEAYDENTDFSGYTATFTGNLTNLNSLFASDESVSFTDWSLTGGYTDLNYNGNGIFSKTFYISDVSSSDITFAYKIGFNRSWDEPSIGLDGAYGANVSDTIHAGARFFTVIADAVNMTCELFDSTEAADRLCYTGTDLGANYSSMGTTFKLWAPTATAVWLNLYAEGKKNCGSAYEIKELKYDSLTGVWDTYVEEDLKNVFYTYSVMVDGQVHETVDIYAKAVGENGDRGMVVDLESTDPDGFETDNFSGVGSITKSIIWETHVQDFSSSATSGISDNNRGKYLAFTETGTTLNNNGITVTGIDYLEDMGINYVHLLPCQDYENDEYDSRYNWGYGTKNYLVPEGKYASDPSDGNTRITEFKKMVLGLHQKNIGVVMDVVYNHTYYTENSWFNLTVPDYYYRKDEAGNFLNGSACGNETASEKVMFRKFMVESILYWAEEYHVDGFRFDLMGLHDTTTMNAIRQTLDDNGFQDVILYGEPWDAGSNGLGSQWTAANKYNMAMLNSGIAVFNDNMRDAVKGTVFSSVDPGFVQGGCMANPSEGSFEKWGYSDNDLISAIKANADETGSGWVWAKSPSDTISYLSVHDNLTLWDKLVSSTISAPTGDNYNMGSNDIVNMNKLGAAIYLTSQGGVLMQSGEEFGRTKYGDENSYESDISVNQLDWSRLERFAGLNNYYKGLIELRKKFAPFMSEDKSAISKMSFVNDSDDNLIAYTIDNSSGDDLQWDTVALLFNSNATDKTVTLNSTVAQWCIVVDGQNAGTDSLGTIMGNTVTVPAGSALVLVDSGSFERVLELENSKGEDNLGGGIEINGYQISATVGGQPNVGGIRIIYSVDSEISGKSVVSSGLIYSVSEETSEENMYVGSTDRYVYSFASTAKGVMPTVFSDSEIATSYAMTMVFVNQQTREYTTKWSVRAYARLEDGTYVYSDITDYTIYDIAGIVYQNCSMSTEMAHNYLYDSILSRVTPEYVKIDYPVSNTIVK